MKRQRDRDIDKELRFHIDETVARYIAEGLTAEEAHRRARAEFGGVQQIKERVHDVWAWRWLEDLSGDVQFAVRTYARMPVFASTTVLTLAFGLGVNVAVFTIVRQVLYNTLPVSHPEELVEIDCGSGSGSTGGNRSCTHSYPAFRLLSERHDGLSGIFAFAPVPNGLVASYQGSREVITGQLAAANIFDVLGLHPVVGRLFVSADDAPGSEAVAVLSYGYWLRSFGGNPAVVGQVLTLDSHPVAIVGVLPRTFRGVTFGEPYDVVLPLGKANLFRRSPPSSSGVVNILETPHLGWLTLLGRRQGNLSNLEIAARLEPLFKQSVEQMIASIPNAIRRQLGLNADNVRVAVRPAGFGAVSNLRRSLEPTLRVVMGVVAIVLLIACVNLSGLFLAQALNRQREFGLRLALGAERSRLVRQVLTESILLAGMGGVAALLLAQWIAPAAFTLATDDTGLRAVDLAPDRWTVTFTFMLAIMIGAVIGVVSVARVSASNPQHALRGFGPAAAPRATKAILGVQIAFTLALVGSAALFLQTLSNFRRVDVGFVTRPLLTVTLDAGLGNLGAVRASEYVAQAADGLARLPGVRAVTYSNTAIGAGIPMSLDLDVPGYTGEVDTPSAGLIYVGPQFTKTLGLTLLRGADFDSAQLFGSVPAAIVNESFATQLFGSVEIVGRTFALRGPGNRPMTIVGVVEDARDRGVKRPTQAVMYLPLGRTPVPTLTFTLQSDVAAGSLMETARETLTRLDSNVGVSRMRTVAAQFDDALRRERLVAALGGVFGALALLLLAVGIYGMLNGMVARRTSEIGVRMALGAARHRIVWMVTRETLVVLAFGALAGVSGHLALGQLIRAQLFGVEPSDPLTAAAAFALLLLVSGAAAWLPVRRATRIQPSDALRHDFA